jgi:hypothetical protein
MDNKQASKCKRVSRFCFLLLAMSAQLHSRPFDMLLSLHTILNYSKLHHLDGVTIGSSTLLYRPGGLTGS